MKNKIEQILMAMVGLLTLLIVGLIVKLYMPADKDAADSSTAYEVPEVKKESKKAKTTNYLKNLETYTDVDVKVDPTKTNNANKIHVTSELTTDTMESALEETDKSSYVKSLSKYTDKVDTNKLDKKKTVKELNADKVEDDKVKLEKDEIEDDIGDAIGAALE